mgnify:FL=1
MTGMPAFGPTHDETELWGLVALARALPRMSAEAYAKEVERHGEAGGNGHSHAGSGAEEERQETEEGHSHGEDDNPEHD